MPFQVIPRELAFYALLDRAAEGVASAASELVAEVDDLDNAADHARRITDLEHAGDDLTHEIIALLNQTFVTPIDRHDLHRLASHTDDVIDLIDGVGDLLVLHGVTEPLPRFRQLVEVLQRATSATRSAIHGLRSLRTVGRVVATIKREEREGDFVYRRAVASLYSGDYRSLEVLMWKDLLAQTEAAIDRCEDIGNTIESVSLKYA